MKQRYVLFIGIFLLHASLHAQVVSDTSVLQHGTDSLIHDSMNYLQQPIVSKPDSVLQTTYDSISLKPRMDSLLYLFSPESFWNSFRFYVYEKSLFLDFTTITILEDADRRVFAGKEKIFYYIIFLLLLFGFLRLVFARYFYDLFRVFFRTTLNQRQVREQLLQSPLPSILLNGYFVLTAGMYVNFMLQHFDLLVTDNFWLQYLYCMMALSGIYFGKFAALKITGLLFNVKEATGSYIFIVFIINKMLGIFLLPLIVLLAFTVGNIYQAAMVFSWIGIGLLYLYRFILSYTVVRKEVKVNPFHFLLYLAAFEIIPLLLIYKLLLLIF